MKISLSEAKTHLSSYIRTVETDEPVIITRHGKPVVALVKAEDLEHLQRLRQAGPQQGLASIAGGWEGSEELADILDHSKRVGNREPVSAE